MPSTRRTTLGAIHVNNGGSGRGGRLSMGGGLGGGGGGGRGGGRASSKSGGGSRQRMSMAPRVSGGESLLGGGDEGGGSSAVTPSRRKSTRKSLGTGLGGGASGSDNGGGGGGGRRQSLAPASMRTDPRPISDKAHMNASIKSLMSYLVKSGYDGGPLSHKVLSRPSGKDFAHILTFLIRRVDPCFNDGTLKFEDEVTYAFRTLGYPFVISKTGLVAVGSPHTWPGLLAALTWLIELLECHEAGGADDDDDDDGDGEGEEADLDAIQKRGERAFFDFLVDAYGAFLQCYDERGEELEDGLVESFDGDNMKIVQDVERMTDLNAGVVETISNLENKSVDLPQLEKKREDYCTDLEKFDDLIKKLREHKAISVKRVDDRRRELEKLKGDLREAGSRVEQLGQRVETQGITVDDVRRMRLEMARLKEGVERAASAKRMYDDALRESEGELSERVEELDAVVREYNGRLAGVRLHPPSAENARGEKFAIDLDVTQAAGAQQSALLGGIDLGRMVVPHLDDLRDTTLAQIVATRRELSELLDQVEASEESLAEESDRAKILEAEKGTCEDRFLRQGEEQESANALRERERDSIEMRVSSLRDPVALETAVAGLKNQCDELEALRRRHEEENVLMKRSVREEISTAFSAYVDHRKHCDMKLARLKRDLTDANDELGRFDYQFHNTDLPST